MKFLLKGLFLFHKESDSGTLKIFTLLCSAVLFLRFDFTYSLAYNLW